MIDTLTNSVEELYTLYHKDIVRFFADHLADREASWDLCHEVFVRLLITLASGTQLQHPQRWLMRVAKNLLIDTYRHQQAASAANLSFDSHELTMLASDATPYVPEQQNLYSRPSYGGRASCFKRSTSDGISKTFFWPTKRFLNTSMP